MRKLTLTVAILLLPFLGHGQTGTPVLSELRPVSSPSLARTAEFTFQVAGDYANPYDPDEIRVDALVTGPAGQSWNVPAFWMEPCAMREEPPSARFTGLTYVQFYLHGAEFPQGKPVVFAISAMTLVDSASGRQRTFPELTEPGNWVSRPGTSLAKSVTEEGTPALVVTVVPDGNGYPGLHFVPEGDFADWSAYDTLRLRVKPWSGLQGQSLQFEIRKGTTKHSFRVINSGSRSGDWFDAVWRYDRQLPAVSWEPPGRGEWRLRIAVPVAGDYTVALTAADRTGTTVGQPQVFPLARTMDHGFIRAAPECPRYLRYDSGESFFSVGTNLLVFKDDFAEYMYYIDRFANVGVNLFRVWLNIPCLGFEKSGLTQYGPRECAVLDALLNHADRRNAALMLCQLDFREVSEKKNNPRGGWDRNPYSTVCVSAADFFTNADAGKAFRKRLRYLVARWSASPAVHSWEFFNEVNITDAWKAGKTDEIRAWHAEMAEYLRSIDPYQHLLTTSLCNTMDHPLWEDSWLELVQPHCYQTAAVDFASFIRKPCLELARHGRPLIPGEFGLMTIKFEDVVEGGVSIHNGMWASVMSGCAGTGMPWWWDWIDRHDYYHQFKGVADFVKDIPWHEQAFLPIPDGNLVIDLPKVTSAPPGPVALKLELHTWDVKAPCNQSSRIKVRRDGTMKPSGCLSTRLHGLRNHGDCHNPKTLVADWPVPGRFVVSVGDVSGYGGANLHIYVDGKETLFKDFIDEDENLNNVMRNYRGDYAVDVPAGKHEITIENTGNDWITLNEVRLENYGPPKVGIQTLGLRGRNIILLWLRNEDYTWFGHMTAQPCEIIEGARLTLRGVPRGRYVVRFYDPQTATWLAETTLRTSWGRLKVALPAVQTDLAVAICPDTGK